MLKRLLGNCKKKRVLGQLPAAADVSLTLLVWALCVSEVPVRLNCMLVWQVSLCLGGSPNVLGLHFWAGCFVSRNPLFLPHYSLLNPSQAFARARHFTRGTLYGHHCTMGQHREDFPFGSFEQCVCCSWKKPILQGVLHACVQLEMVKPAWSIQVLSALPLQLGWEWSTTCPRVVVDAEQVCPVRWAGDRSQVKFLL